MLKHEVTNEADVDIRVDYRGEWRQSRKDVLDVRFEEEEINGGVDENR